MINIFYSAFSQYPNDSIVQQKQALLPTRIQEKIDKYKDKWDRLLRLTGILLLGEYIKMNGLDKEFSLESIVVNNNGKPSFGQSLFFNKAYAENLCLLAVSTHGEIGIDIEKIRTLDLEMYSDYFTEREWHLIHSAHNPQAAFFDYWTRKEAVLKSIGYGLTMNMNEREVIAEVVNIQNRLIHLKKIDFLPGYSCHIATTGEHEIALKEMYLYGG